MSESNPLLSQSRRHPSAGNLNSRPTLLRLGDAPQQLPPVAYPHGVDPSTEQVQFGPDLDDTAIGRLIGSAGPMEGRRVLVLGCGAGASAITLARKGARVIAVEASTARLTQARAAAEVADVRIEFHHSDLADLAFLRGDSIELVVAVYSLAGVQDLGRVFRQLHRIMKSEASLVLSLPHPFSMMLEADEEEISSPYLTRSAWADQVVPWRAGGDEGVSHVHQLGELFMTLIRSNFRVDAMLEPPAVEGRRSVHWSPLAEWLPSTVIMRARKHGT